NARVGSKSEYGRDKQQDRQSDVGSSCHSRHVSLFHHIHVSSGS
ncbi:hypothetical protein Pcinc_032315, partial [Petrolisthes cinctipes]